MLRGMMLDLAVRFVCVGTVFRFFHPSLVFPADTNALGEAASFPPVRYALRTHTRHLIGMGGYIQTPLPVRKPLCTCRLDLTGRNAAFDVAALAKQTDERLAGAPLTLSLPTHN